MIDQTRIDKFKQILDQTKGQTVSIAVTQADPDSMGAAVGLQAIIREYDKKHHGKRRPVDIFYCGDIAHPQNVTICNKFGLQDRLHPIADIQSIIDDAVIVLVDSSTINDSRLTGLGEGITINPTIVIDHHEGNDLPDETDNTCYIIETKQVGSASTLVAELLTALWTQEQPGDLLDEFFAEDNETTLDVAKLLALGIYIDVHQEVARYRRDLAVFQRLTSYFSWDELADVTQYRIPRRQLRTMAHAYAQQEIQGTRLLTSAGILSPEEGDVVSTVADQMLPVEGIQIVVVFALIADPQQPHLRISARSWGHGVSLTGFLRERFKNGGAKVSRDGMGEGGARISIPMEWFWDPRIKEALEAFAFQRMRLDVFDEDGDGSQVTS